VPYVKTSVRTTRSGTVRYLQLAHNEWDPAAQRSRTRILHNFGREDEIDKDQVRRLVSALSRLLDPAEALAASEPGELSVTASRPLGGTHALDALWRRLGLDKVTARALAARPGRGRRPDPDAERVLFALAANRALAASSKLACAEWVREDVHVDGLDDTSDDAIAIRIASHFSPCYKSTSGGCHSVYADRAVLSVLVQNSILSCTCGMTLKVLRSD